MILQTPPTHYIFILQCKMLDHLKQIRSALEKSVFFLQHEVIMTSYYDTCTRDFNVNTYIKLHVSHLYKYVY